MSSARKTLITIILGSLLIAAGGCDTLQGNNQTADALSASGVVEAKEVTITPELSGKIVEVFVGEGEVVSAGDKLFRIEDKILEAQKKQIVTAQEAARAGLGAAQASLAVAEAGLKAAQAQLRMANIQTQMERNALRLAEQATRVQAWDEELSNEFETPPWYFTKETEIAAAQAEVEAAKEALDTETENYNKVLDEASNADIKAAEERLAEAQATFLIAEALKERDIASQDKEKIEDYIQEFYDSAKAELDSAQKELDNLLSDQAYEDVLEAKARLAVAKERYETALDRLNSLLTGDNSLQMHLAEANLELVKAGVAQAEAMVKQAKAGVLQANKALASAGAELEVINTQIEKLIVRAPIDGVITVRNVQPGEVVQAGLPVMTISQLDKLTVTVYIPEDSYGEIMLGQTAKVSSDSFADITFQANVTRIADRAEYTPRNVQTKEDRKNIVFAIELSLEDTQGKLKPGMPVDVVFIP